MTSGPHEGESPLDQQSESTSAPVPEQDPPVLTRRTPVLTWGLWAAWTLLGLALVVAAFVTLD